MTHVHEFANWIEEPGDQSRQLEWACECECGFARERAAWRVIVTGSRSLGDPTPVWDALIEEALVTDFLGLPMVVIEGQCPYGGADLFAEQWATIPAAKDRGIFHDPFPANWKALGKRAGPYRNQQMVDAGADMRLASPTVESRGTWDCVRRAEAAGIPVKVFEQ